MKNHLVRGKTFFVLLGLSLLSVLCVFPYVLSIQGESIKTINKPIWLLLTAQLIQCLILFSVVIYFGLVLTRKIDFQLPLLEGAPGKRMTALKSFLGQSIGVGIGAAVAIYALDTAFTLRGATISTHQNLAPIWQKLLAAVYGGVTEEVIMRLFVMTLFIWIGMKAFRQNRPSKVHVGVSMILAAVIFGLGHLPITASVTRLDGIVITRAVVLNGIAGIAFGWLFWKKGIESAIIAHFTADIFLLTLLPLVFA